jgi:uncharacterized membrane protein YkvA (DUF1232 family)
MINEKSFKKTTDVVDQIDEKRGFPWGSLIIAIICLIYLLNPIAGIDIIPDNLPVVGNLDEMGVTLLFIRSLRKIKNRGKTNSSSESPDK